MKVNNAERTFEIFLGRWGYLGKVIFLLKDDPPWDFRAISAISPASSFNIYIERVQQHEKRQDSYLLDDSPIGGIPYSRLFW